jgi:hypothetical protein
MRGPLIQGTHELITAIVQSLTSGESIDNPKLAQLAEGGIRRGPPEGAYTSRDACDALETAVN